MREIKFRGVTDENELVYPDNKPFGGLKSYDILQRFSIVEQYTGLKDNKRTKEFPDGQKIYEGDIVKGYDYQNVDHWFKGVIDFFDGSFYIDSKKGITYYRWIDYEIEIIGNIHENPELL